jgi:hypothetical protein
MKESRVSAVAAPNLCGHAARAMAAELTPNQQHVNHKRPQQTMLHKWGRKN